MGNVVKRSTVAGTQNSGKDKSQMSKAGEGLCLRGRIGGKFAAFFHEIRLKSRHRQVRWVMR